MRTDLRYLVSLLIVLSAVGATGAAESVPGEAEGDSALPTVALPGLGEFTIGTPCVHANLALYPLVARDPATIDADFLTLGEALKRKLVKVHETRDVNKLAISNRSKDKHVFIQAGDIVRGGRQDRMASFDVVLGPQSGRVPLDAFCVEQGRWSRRGNEGVAEFSSSNNRVSTTRLALAARSTKSQAAVWNAVADAQSELARSVSVQVRDARSPTSMELTLESPAVKQGIQPFRDALDACVGDVDGAVGVAVAINGRLTGASLYAWAELFDMSWPKILNATAVEALAASAGKETGSGQGDDDGGDTMPPGSLAVGDFLWIPDDARADRQAIRRGLVERRYSFNGIVRFVTHDAQLGWVHAELLSQRP